MDNMGYLFAAYTIIWAVIFGYIFYMQRKQRKLEQQIDMWRDSTDSDNKQ